MTALLPSVERDYREAANQTSPEPGPAEALFMAYVFFGMAAWLYWARWWRL